MTVMQIALSDSLRAFIENQATLHGYKSASDYVLALIRKAQQSYSAELEVASSVSSERQEATLAASTSAAEPAAHSPAYQLPSDLLTTYHRWLDKKFCQGLTPDEETELERAGRLLDAADLATPLEQQIDQKAQNEHSRRMEILTRVIVQLKSL